MKDSYDEERINHHNQSNHENDDPVRVEVSRSVTINS